MRRAGLLVLTALAVAGCSGGLAKPTVTSRQIADFEAISVKYFHDRYGVCHLEAAQEFNAANTALDRRYERFLAKVSGTKIGVAIEAQMVSEKKKLNESGWTVDCETEVRPETRVQILAGLAAADHTLQQLEQKLADTVGTRG